MNSENHVAQISVPTEVQGRVIDQILVQSGGVGLGVILTLVGSVAIAHWLGLKPAITHWVERQKAQTEALESFSSAFGKFVGEYQQSTREIKDSLIEIKGGIRDALSSKRR